MTLPRWPEPEDDEARFAAVEQYDRRLRAIGDRPAYRLVAALLKRARRAELEDPEPPRLAPLWYER